MQELTLNRGQHHKKYEREDGSYLYTIHSNGNSLHKKINGFWNDIDTSMVKDGNFIATRGNHLDVVCRKDGKRENILNIKKDKDEVSISLTYLSINENEINLPDKLSEPILKEKDVLSYRIQEGINYVVSVNRDKYQTYIECDFIVYNFKIREELKYKGRIENLKIANPSMWNNKGDSSEDIDQSFIQTGKNAITITKEPNLLGRKWLGLQRGNIAIDSYLIYSSTADGYVSYTNTNWTTCHDAATGAAVGSTNTAHNRGAGSCYTGYNIYRGFFYFSLTGVNAIETIFSANIQIRGATYAQGDVSCQQGTQAASLTTADFDSFSGEYWGIVSPWELAYNTFNLNDDGLNAIRRNLNGTLKAATREYSHDYLNSAPSTSYYNGCYYSDNSGTDYDPILNITSAYAQQTIIL